MQRLSNKLLVDRYDALVQRAQERCDEADSTNARQVLLRLIARLNLRGMRELERRQREAEEKLWKDSLFPTKPRPGSWF